MSLSPEMRASDGDRDRTAASLREHCAQGRITVEELNERLESAYQARTLGELQQVTADLPEEDLHTRPVPATQRSSPAPRGRRNDMMGFGWGSWGSVSVVCFTIWLITVVASAHWIYPWWIWVAGPWGALMLAGRLFGNGGNRRD